MNRGCPGQPAWWSTIHIILRFPKFPCPHLSLAPSSRALVSLLLGISFWTSYRLLNCNVSKLMSGSPPSLTTTPPGPTTGFSSCVPHLRKQHWCPLTCSKPDPGSHPGSLPLTVPRGSLPEPSPLPLSVPSSAQDSLPLKDWPSCHYSRSFNY